MSRLFLTSWIVVLSCCGVSASADNAFHELACNIAEVQGKAPEIFGTMRFRWLEVAPDDATCTTLLVFDNQETALVRREVKVGSDKQTQLLVVSRANRTVRPITGRSRQSRQRTTSASFGEGGSRGGKPLPDVADSIEVLRVRSRGSSIIGVETFQVRFRLVQIQLPSETVQPQSRWEDQPLVEFDLCARRVSLDASIYRSVAEKIAACENYSRDEQGAFRQFWDF